MIIDYCAILQYIAKGVGVSEKKSEITRYLRYACHGQDPGTASNPPTIFPSSFRVAFSILLGSMYVIPHSSGNGNPAIRFINRNKNPNFKASIEKV